VPAPATANPATITTIATVKSNAQPSARPAAAQVQQVQTAQAAAKSAAKPADRTAGKPAGKPAGTAAEKPVMLASAGDAVPVKAAAQELAAKPHGGWMIQVGAFDIEKDAKERLNDAQSKAKDVLGEASPFTEPVAKGHKTLYRARFAGLDKLQAVNACKSLKRSEIPCMMLKN
jgi:D-alanyl-D-alanine carboxypeptidase